MDARTETGVEGVEAADEPCLPFDNIYSIGEHLPLHSKELSALCRHSSLFYRSFQEKRLRTLVSQLLTEPDLSKMSDNFKAVGKILQIRPTLATTTINLNALPATTNPELQQKRNYARHHQLLRTLTRFATYGIEAPWVNSVLTLFLNNDVVFFNPDQTNHSLLDLAVHVCANDVVNFLYDHHLVDTNKIDPFILYNLQNHFDPQNSNWNGRKTNVVNRICIEHPYLFYRAGCLISEREFATFLHHLNFDYNISKNAYCYARYQLTQFYLHQLTEMTPQSLFNHLMTNHSEILERDITKLLKNKLGLTTMDRLPEILKLILLSDYSSRHSHTYQTIGVQLYQYYIAHHASLLPEHAHQALMLAATFICMAGKNAMADQTLVHILYLLRELPLPQNPLSLDNYILEYSAETLTCVNLMVDFYSAFTQRDIDNLDAHPFSTLQSYAARVYIDQAIHSPKKSSFM